MSPAAVKSAAEKLQEEADKLAAKLAEVRAAEAAENERVRAAGQAAVDAFFDDLGHPSGADIDAAQVDFVEAVRVADGPGALSAWLRWRLEVGRYRAVHFEADMAHRDRQRRRMAVDEDFRESLRDRNSDSVAPRPLPGRDTGKDGELSFERALVEAALLAQADAQRQKAEQLAADLKKLRADAEAAARKDNA